MGSLDFYVVEEPIAVVSTKVSEHCTFRVLFVDEGVST